MTETSESTATCDATSAWSDGVTTHCQLPSGHDGEHRDDRREVVNPEVTGLRAELEKMIDFAGSQSNARRAAEAKIDAIERWLRPEVVVGWIQPRGYRERYLAEDVIRGLLNGGPISKDQAV